MFALLFSIVVIFAEYGVRAHAILKFIMLYMIVCFIIAMISFAFSVTPIFFMVSIVTDLAYINLLFKIVGICVLMLNICVYLFRHSVLYISLFIFNSMYQVSEESVIDLAQAYVKPFIFSIIEGERPEPSMVEVDGRLIDHSNLPELVSDDPILALSLTLYWILVPEPKLFWVQSIWLGFIIFFLIFEKVLKSFARLFGYYLKVSKLLLVLVTFGLLGDLYLVRRVSILISWIISTIVTLPILLFKRGAHRALFWWLRALFILLIVKTSQFYFLAMFMLKRHRGGPKAFAKRGARFRVLWTNTFMNAQRFIDDISLPEFIRSIPEVISSDSINRSLIRLEELGWPEAVRLTEDTSHEWSIGQMDFSTGMRQMKTYIDHELDDLRKMAEPYIRTETYQTVELELKSLERYFVNPDYNFPKLSVDEVWTLVSDIFKDSKLTPFNTIFRKWVKKYALGAVWPDYSGKRPKKLKRSKAISMVGGWQAFLNLVQETFKVGTSILGVSTVSVKGEALPKSKADSGKVRTVIGAPIVHYIMSTVWNYYPNHNFKWQENSIKIGIPINGANFSKLWEEHSRYDKHFAGDFSAFDSTLSGKIVDLIAGIRKKGFVRHRDYHKIVYLIDHNYRDLLTAPMGVTSTGKVYAKGLGLSTGQSSTSMDNSLGLNIIYLMAWKDITGRKASEFKYYNKLSNYGDDHILSYLKTAPPEWNPDNIMRWVQKWGVVLRDECPSRKLEEMEFLSKRGRPPSPDDIALFKELGIKVPQFVISHNPVKLIGKMSANVKSMDRFYRAKRLTSYLYLCAHHPEIYKQARVAIDRIITGQSDAPAGNTTKRSGKPISVNWDIPSYSDVIRKWYDPQTNLKPREIGTGYSSNSDPNEHLDNDEDSELMSTGLSEHLAIIADIVSLLPDVLNPVIYNAGYIETLLNKCVPYTDWVAALMRQANDAYTPNHLAKLLERTPYNFLGKSPSFLCSDARYPLGKMLLSHWIFMCLHWRPSGISLSAIIGSLNKFSSNIQFQLNGKLHTYDVANSIDIYNLLLVMGLSFLPELELPAIIGAIEIPNLGLLLDQLWDIVWSAVWTRVPPNFKAAVNVIRNFCMKGERVIIQAPTGTGKSTGMVAHIYKEMAPEIHKLIVVEPRSILVGTISSYVRTQYGLPATGFTSGLIGDNSARVIYCTPQEVFLHEEWIKKDNLFIIDECHVQESAVQVLPLLLAKRKIPTVMTSATITDDIRNSGYFVDLPVARVWKIEDMPISEIKSATYQHTLTVYSNQVREMVNAFVHMRILIFVLDKGHAYNLARSLPGKTCVLSSDSTTVDENAQFFVSTSVSDVGITINGIDLVITMDLTREAITTGFESTSTSISRMTKELLQQRKGRTGRTNNGYFKLFKIFGDWVAPPVTRDEKMMVFELLGNAMPASLLNEALPGSLLKIYPSVGDSDAFLDKFTQNVVNFQKELNSGSGGFKIPNLDIDRSEPPYITHHNHLPSGEVVEDKVLTLNGRQVAAFVLWAGAYAASKSVALTESNIRNFMTQTYNFNASSFRSHLDALTGKKKTVQMKFSFGKKATPGAPLALEKAPEPIDPNYVRGAQSSGHVDDTGVSLERRLTEKSHLLPGGWWDDFNDPKNKYW